MGKYSDIEKKIVASMNLDLNRSMAKNIDLHMMNASRWGVTRHEAKCISLSADMSGCSGDTVAKIRGWDGIDKGKV